MLLTVGVKRLSHRFIRRHAGKIPILVIHQIAEQSEAYVMYLSGMMA